MSANDPPLLIESVPIDGNCVGSRWIAIDCGRLAQLVAIVAMGQVTNAAFILRELRPASPAISPNELRLEAKIRLSVQSGSSPPRNGYPQWHRDGFIFEAISWIASCQELGPLGYLTDPHVSATTQGLDGLMIELSDDKSKIVRSTVFEDKCTDNPRSVFIQKVIPALLDRHENRRSAELVATASLLLRIAGIDDSAISTMVASVMNRNERRYRASFALTPQYDNQASRQDLFKDYEKVYGISSNQRIGAGLIVTGALRSWFDNLATQAVDFIDALGVDPNSV